LRPRRASEIAERDIPRRSSRAPNREEANAHFITCPLWEATVASRSTVLMLDRCPKKTS
jgi:hypothetical protein